MPVIVDHQVRVDASVKCQNRVGYNFFAEDWFDTTRFLFMIVKKTQGQKNKTYIAFIHAWTCSIDHSNS